MRQNTYHLGSLVTRIIFNRGEIVLKVVRLSQPTPLGKIIDKLLEKGTPPAFIRADDGVARITF